MCYVVVWKEDPNDKMKSIKIAAYIADWSEPGTMGTPSVFQQRHLHGQNSYVTGVRPEGCPVYHLTWVDGDYQ